ncbi:MAG: hypothetical protein COV69_03845 [Parcubacteria group bacterium CG11_big_fil_rev_8_21_14_0_20_39_14]|nr:MAG: hypothetical protein COV69_03845 [Parcubacteria group bacterium CG11_big_fil_rev_8_21_14_0_20_39_14]PIS35772.1 MAG: hypothetical protein COT36_00910 [Parcubacteria group bacterium CG08_land_8_20_14_0_20_38_56]
MKKTIFFLIIFSFIFPNFAQAFFSFDNAGNTVEALFKSVKKAVWDWIRPVLGFGAGMTATATELTGEGISNLLEGIAGCLDFLIKKEKILGGGAAVQSKLEAVGWNIFYWSDQKLNTNYLRLEKDFPFSASLPSPPEPLPTETNKGEEKQDQPGPLLPNNPPKATELTMSPAECSASCHSCPNPLNPILYWTFSDSDEKDIQSKYLVQVDNNKNFSSPEIEKENSGSSQNFVVMNGNLSYGQTYWWRVKVWDSRGGQSDWAVYLKPYIVPISAYPKPDFSWEPLSPFLGEEVQFIDDSKAYEGTVIKNWRWTFQDAVLESSDKENPIAIFSLTAGSKTVSLTITDSNGLYCSISKSTSIKKTVLPKW